MIDTNKAVKGVFWSTIERFATQGCQLLLSIIIARLVSPSDYGKLAMATVLLSIAEMLVDCGFTNALIQKKDKTISDYSTVFWTNFIIAIFIYIILYASAPFISSFYKIPELNEIIRIISICIIINSLYIVQRTRFVIDINFKTQSIISITSVCIGGVLGIVLAYWGYGVWALIAQSLLFSFVSLILYWWCSKWRPSFLFSKGSFNYLFGFGSKLMVTGMITTLYNNMNTIVIAKFYNSVDLGIYNRADSFARQPMSSITHVLARVIYPLECELQDDNRELLGKFNQFLRLTAYVVFPLMFGLAALAEPIILVLLSNKWSGCIPLFRILCFVSLFNPIIRLAWDIFNVKNRTDLSMLNEIINKTIAIIALFLFLPFGLKAVCVGMLAYMVLNLTIMTIFTNRILPGLNIFDIVRQVLNPLIMSVMMYIIITMSMCLSHSNLIKLFVGIFVGITTYLIVSLLSKSKELSMIINIIKRKKM